MSTGSAWGSREEFLHPRDSHGRFRNTWRMPQAAADAISKFLDSFNPKTFGTDQEAQSWIHNESRKNRLGTNAGAAITNFVKGFSNVNNNLRAGKADSQAAQMLKGAEPLPNDLILTKTVDPTAFGLSPDNIANVEELTGKLIHDPGFTSANIGTPNPPTGPGPHIQMTIATPAGTKAIVPQVSSPTSEVMLIPDQNLRVTKVTPDGKGGYYMMAVATPGEVPKEKSTPLHAAPPAPAPLNLPPKPGEQPATPGTAPAVAEPPAPAATPISIAPTPPAPAVPVQPGFQSTTTAPRTEPNVVEALTPGGTPTSSAQPAGPATPAAVPASPVDFRQAVKDANISSPTEGPRRKQWNNAYLGVVGGKKHPEDALRELRADIEHNKATLADDIKTNTDSGPLPNDIKAQEALANLIEEKFNLGPVTPEEHRNAAQELLSKTPAGDNAARNLRLQADKHIRLADQLEKAQKATTKKATPSGAKLARSPGAVRPTKAAAPAAKAAKAAAPEAPATESAIPEKATIAQLRQIAKDRGVKIPSKLTRKDDIRTHLEGGGAPSVSAKPSVEDRVAKLLLDKIKANDPKIADKILKDMPPADRKAVEEGIARVEGHATGLKEEAIPEKATIADLRKIAQERGVKIPSKLTRKADIRAHLEGAGKAPSGPEGARSRQGHIDEVRKVSDLLSGLDGALDDGASKEAMRIKVEADAKRLGAPDNVRDNLLKAVDTGDKSKIRAAIDKAGKDAGLSAHSGNAGGITKFNPAKHEALGEKLTTGHEVRVARPGHEATLPGGEKVQLSKAKVESHVPEVKAPAAKVESALPRGATAADKAVTAQLREGDKILVSKNGAGTWSVARQKTGATTLTVSRTELSGGRRGRRTVHGKDDAGNDISVKNVAAHQTFFKKTEPGKAALPKAEAPAKAESALPAHADLDKMVADLKLDPKVVKDRKAILDHVRTDLAEGKKTPAQVGRELDQSISGIESSAAIRFGGHIGNPSEERKVELRKQLEAHRHEASELRKLADKLKATRRTPGSTPAKAAPAVKAAPAAPIGISSKDVKEGDAIVWQPPGETPVLGHIVKNGRFTNIKWSSGREEPLRSNRRDPSLRKATEADVKELGESGKATPATIEAPAELKKAYAQTTMAELRKQANDNGITVPASARTKKDVFDRIVQEMAKRELARRGTARATRTEATKAAPATKVAKAATAEVRAPSIRSITSRRLAERAQEEKAKFSSKPILENNWGGTGGEVNFHPDGVIGLALERMGEDKKLDVNGEPLANVVGKLATENVRGTKTAQQVIDELDSLAKRLPEGKAKSELEQAAKTLDAPKRSIDIPAHTPAPLQDLAHSLEKIPLARRTHDSVGRKLRNEPVLDRLSSVLAEYSQGNMRGMALIDEIERLANTSHESQEGKFEIDRAIRHAVEELKKIGFKNLNPPPGGWK